MESGVGEYAYLIILIIAALSGLLKKKKPAANTNSAPAKPKRTWEDVLKELTPIDQEDIEPERQITPEAPIKIKQKKAPVEQEMSYETLKDTSVLKAKKQVAQTVVAHHSNFDTIDKKNAEDSFDEVQFETLEDAKRAFIYSEIFNKKY